MAHSVIYVGLTRKKEWMEAMHWRAVTAVKLSHVSGYVCCNIKLSKREVTFRLNSFEENL